MHRTMSAWVLVTFCACVLVAFFCYNNILNENLQEVETSYNDATVKLNRLNGETADLKEQLMLVGTDDFIETQARTMYGYMMPDEIRFVINNPEVLYGDEEIPSR